MTPNSGLYMAFHLIIILIAQTIKFVRTKLLPTMIILSVLIMLSFSLVAVFGKTLDENNHFKFYKKFTQQCEPVEREYNSKKIIIRIDDVQAFWLRDVQIKMLDELIRRNIPALLGVIPLNINEDEKLFNYLKTNNCKFEIAMHGWDQGKDSGYLIPEFKDLNKEEALEKITLGKFTLEEISQKPLLTFIPPNNKYSTGTKIALIESGFKIISAEGNGLFDRTATSYDWDNKIMVPPENIASSCQTSLNKFDLCVIMIHPQDYTSRGELDEDKFINYLKLLDELEKLDGMFTTTSALRYWQQLYPKINERETRKILERRNGEETTNDEMNNKEKIYKETFTTIFWIGEGASEDNSYISNAQSAWDPYWLNHYGGIDSPDDRCGYKPCGFEPKENPFYFALPYNDIDEDGILKESAYTLGWGEKTDPQYSTVKNKWIEIVYGKNVCYGQWEDVGPYEIDDFDYVFGEATQPKNSVGVNAGLDISPALKDCLCLEDNDITKWRFIEEVEIPDGPWKEITTESRSFIY